jgi:hypothetical protein
MHAAYDNPLRELISGDVYALLAEHNLLNAKGIRDYKIRQEFRALRDQDVSASDAIEELRDRYPYLQFDTLRKIVYGLRKRSHGDREASPSQSMDAGAETRRRAA